MCSCDSAQNVQAEDNSMFKWLAALLALLFSASGVDTQDYVGHVAAEAAYSALLSAGSPSKPKVPTKDCTTCKGTGRVPTGDSNHPWTKCPDCDGSLSSNADKQPAADPTEVKIPKSDPTRYTQPQPGTKLVR